MGRNIKYTFKDWWEGRIYFGGQTVVLQEEVIKFRNLCTHARYNQLSAGDESRIKRMQKSLHNAAVRKRFHELKGFYIKSSKNSSEPLILTNGILRDLDTLFDPKTVIPFDGWIELRYLGRNIYYGDNENLPLKNFFRAQIINGLRFYDHIQSPKQTRLLRALYMIIEA